MDNSKLIFEATNVREKAYSPYSHFSVGASILCVDGSVFTGCNVENASYGAACCAERVALFKAISEGHKDFLKIAIVSSSKDITPPCGICLQVMSEFMPNGIIVLSSANGQVVEYKVNELLPVTFEKSFLSR